MQGKMKKQGGRTADMLGRTGVIPLSEARRLLQRYMPSAVADVEELSLEEARSRIVAREICSPENLPPHPRSTMDGYAVRARDTFGASESLPVYLAVSGEVLMGDFPRQGPEPGCCFRIATGGFLPPQTDAVVMLEHTVQVDEGLIEVISPVPEGGNRIAPGEDIAEHAAVLSVGHCLRSQDLALLAGLGISSVRVLRRVRVGVISTGDEIVDHRQTPAAGKIRDVNAVHLAALISEAGALPRHYGIVPDRQGALSIALDKARRENDMVLLSGSSSVGTRDLGEQVLEKLGEPGIIFHGVAVKPGKPVIFAMAGGTPVFGLPGHPVSAAVSYRLFVAPVLSGLAGRVDHGLPTMKTVTARLMRNVSSAAGRTDFVQVRIGKKGRDDMFEAEPVFGKSGALFSMVQAHGYLEIAEKQQGAREGELITVHLYPD
jgi:molybdopterin molybdotransferase